MTKNKKIIQFILIFIGLILIISTYYFYPKFIKKKIAGEKTILTEEAQVDETIINTFENIEYKGIYNFVNPFSVNSEEAYILAENPDVLYMTNMKVSINMKDGRIIVVKSDSGKYNKVTYDCFFIDNVKATDGDTVVFSENLDLLATEDSAHIYNDVFLTNDKGSLRADKVDYNFETKYYKVSMFDNTKVKIKLIR